jgi:hypothetical protein
MRKVIVPLIVVLLVAMVVVPVSGQAFANTFDHILTQTLRTTGDATIGDDLAVADTLTVTGAAAFNGGSNLGATSSSSLNVSGATSIGTFVSIAPQGAVVVTEGSVITPTGSFQRIEAAGSVTGSLGVPQSGQIVTLMNSSANAITIADTTGQVLSANAVLGQWDTLTVIGYGSAWHELARSNN